MSLTEFVLAFVGIVIGLGVADLLTSVHKLLRAGSRVRWDWLTIAYAAFMLYSIIVFWWWQFGYLRPGETLTIAEFLPSFLFLALSFLMVASALPDDVPAEGLDLRAFYWESLRHRWGLLTTALLFNLLPALRWAFRDGIGWADVLEVLPVLCSFLLAAGAMRVRAAWYQAAALAILFSVTSFYNLFQPIGP